MSNKIVLEKELALKDAPEETESKQTLGAQFYDELVLADEAWRIGKFINDGFSLPEAVARLTEMDGTLTPDELSSVLTQAQAAYSDPNAVLALDEERGHIRWMPKETAEEADLPYVRSVKQAINSLADEDGMSYDEMAEEIAPKYSKYLKEYNAGGGVSSALGSLVADRSTELLNDPQLAGKDNAWTKAIVGDAAEGASMALPIGWMGKGWKGAKSLKQIKNWADKLSRVGRGAGAGAVGGLGGYGAGLTSDKLIEGNRDERSFDPADAAIAAGVGAGVGGVAGTIQPERYDDAARRVLFKDTKGNNKAQIYPNGYQQVKDELINAARNRQPLSDYLYEPMNDAQFEGAVYRTPKLPERSRIVQADEVPPQNSDVIGRKVKLVDSPEGATNVGDGSNGLKFTGGEPTRDDIANYNKLIAQRGKYAEELQDLRAKRPANEVVRPNVKPYDNSTEMAEIGNQLRIAAENGDSKQYNRLAMQMAKLTDKAGRNASNIGRQQGAVDVENAKRAKNLEGLDTRISFLENELAQAEPMVPTKVPSNVRLTGADSRLAEEWRKGYNKMHQDTPIPAAHHDNIKKFLTASQNTNRPENKIATNAYENSKRGFNAERGAYKFGENSTKYDQFMRDYIYGKPEIDGDKAMTDAFDQAKKETSRRHLETEGANGANEYVGGNDFDAKVYKKIGSDNRKKRHVAARLPYGFTSAGTDTEEDLDFIPRK